MSTIKVTTLVKVTSHGSGGRGQILACAAKAIVARDQLTSKLFLKEAVGALMVVRLGFNTENAKRVILTAQPFGGSGVAAFMNEYAATIKSEQDEFNHWVAKAGEPALDPKVDEPSIIAKPEPVNPWHDLFYVQDEERNAFSMAKTLAGKIPSKVMIIGASGYGKTSLPKAFAAQNKMKYVRFNVALVRDPEEFFGWRTVEDGDVKFLPSEFTQAITEGNAVVVLDELNRATPEMANALFPILDDDARTVVFGTEVKVGPNVIIVCTINVGYQFVGTFAIDQALLNRMDITLRVAPLPKNIEQEILTRRCGVTKPQATTIVNVCNKLRDLTNDGKILVDASTRTSIRVAKFVANGASFQDAFAWAVVNGCDIEERKEIIDTISASL